jgi:hypothetical protein
MSDQPPATGSESGTLPGPRRLQPAGEALVIMVAGLMLWLLIEAPRLERAAEVAPFGARRTASLIFLRPFAAVSDLLGFGRLTAGMERALGKEELRAGVEVQAPPPPPPEATFPTTEDPTPAPPASPVEPLEALPNPSTDNKLRVAVVGDSFAIGLASAVGSALDPELVQVSAQGELATGLARPDAFDWPDRVRRIVRDFRPEVLVVMLGSNDAQSISYPGGRFISTGSHEWVLAYRAEIEELISVATEGGARVAWVGLPPMKEGIRHRWARQLNQEYAEVAAAHPESTFVDTWETFARRDGSYTAYLRDEEGNTDLVRAADGVHFSPTGYRMVADLIIDRMREAWGLDPVALV